MREPESRRAGKPGIYIDHNATSPAVIQITDTYANPSSPHEAGRRARDAMEKARANIASLIGAKPGELYFTSGGTEADNWAVWSALCGYPSLVTSAIEHHAILRPARRAHAWILEVDHAGKVSLPHLKRLLDGRELGEDGGVISVMHANNETGILQPIRAISELAHEHGQIVHTDAVQSFGKIPVDVNELGVDMMTISAHKMGGPKGLGALYVRQGVRISPLIRGGHQERDKRAGTENVVGIVAFGLAAEYAHRDMEEKRVRMARMRERLLDGIKEQLDGVRNNTLLLAHSIPNTLNLSFKGVDSEALLLLLDQEGICVSNGAACESGLSEPSHVLLAMGRSPEEARSAIRFSMAPSNTPEEVEAVIEAVVRLVKLLRGVVDGRKGHVSYPEK